MMDEGVGVREEGGGVKDPDLAKLCLFFWIRIANT